MRINAPMSGLAIAAVVVFIGLGLSPLPSGGSDMTITVTSSVFSDGGMIPKKYTCDGEDISPDLKWSGVPQGAKSLALICDDPDAPVGTWVHWIFHM